MQTKLTLTSISIVACFLGAKFWPVLSYYHQKMVDLFIIKNAQMYSILHVASNAILGMSCKMDLQLEYAYPMVIGVEFNPG